MNMNQNPFEEDLKNVLEKYGRDIVQSVKDGKIDPVKRFVVLHVFYPVKRKIIQY